jgi:hypothetical protein
MGSGHPEERRKPLDITFIPYMKGISEKFRHRGNCFNIKIVIETKHMLTGMFMRTGPVRSSHQTANCVYSTLCGCGRNYFGETGRP